MAGAEYVHGKYPLPVIQDEIGASTLVSIEEAGGFDEFFADAIELMERENPKLLASIAQYVQARRVVEPEIYSPEAASVTTDVMILTHELLRRQGEADALKRKMEAGQEGLT